MRQFRTHGFPAWLSFTARLYVVVQLACVLLTAEQAQALRSEEAAKQLGYTGKGMAIVLFTPLPETETVRFDSVLELEPPVLNTGPYPPARPKPIRYA